MEEKKRGDCRNTREKSVLERKRDFPDAPLKVVDRGRFCTAREIRVPQLSHV